MNGKALLVVGALVIGLGACGTTTQRALPPAAATSTTIDPDSTFINDLETIDSSLLTDATFGTLFVLGRGICSDFYSGSTAQTFGQAIINDSSSGLTAFQMGEVAAAGVFAYCPQDIPTMNAYDKQILSQ